MSELHQALESFYSLRFDDTDLASDHSIFAAFLRAGVFGMRLFSSIGIKRYLVNSRRALDMVRSDLNSADVEISRIFLPVYLPMGAGIDLCHRIPAGDDRHTRTSRNWHFWLSWTLQADQSGHRRSA